LSCPFCCYKLSFPEDDLDKERAEERLSLPGPHGNLEYYHLYCREPDIQAMRIALDGAVDMASEAYCAAMMEQSSFDVTIDRLEILARELRELEMTLALVMHSQCEKKDIKPMRTRNVTYRISEGKIPDVMRTLGVGGVVDADRDQSNYVWANLFGLRTMAEEGEIPNLSTACALDFAHIGLVSDAFKNWQRQNCSFLGNRGSKLSDAALRLDGALLLRPNLMQTRIKEKLDE
jgi:hypothetical protein